MKAWDALNIRWSFQVGFCGFKTPSSSIRAGVGGARSAAVDGAVDAAHSTLIAFCLLNFCPLNPEKQVSSGKRTSQGCRPTKLKRQIGGPNDHLDLINDLKVALGLPKLLVLLPELAFGDPGKIRLNFAKLFDAYPEWSAFARCRA